MDCSIFISPTEITQGGSCHGNFGILRGPSVSAGQRNHSNTFCRRTLVGEGCTLSVRNPTSFYVHHGVQPIKSRTRCTMFPISSQPEPEPEGCGSDQCCTALCNFWHPAVRSPKDQWSEQLSTVHHSNCYRWEISERVAPLHTLSAMRVCVFKVSGLMSLLVSIIPGSAFSGCLKTRLLNVLLVGMGTALVSLVYFWAIYL